GIVSEDYAKKHFLDKNPIGAVQTFTLASVQGIPVKIVDVYKSVPASDEPINNVSFYFCGDEKTINENYNLDFISLRMNIVLKEGFSEQQLLKALNDCVLPFGLSADISKVSENPELRKIVTIRIFSYLIGSLILIASVIGFLRIQTQLFRLRRRELALRIVNGATSANLFGLLFTEIAITILLSVAISILLGILLQDYLGMKLALFMDYSIYKVKDLGLYSLVIGGVLAAICSLIAWFTLLSVCKPGKSLAKNMRRSTRHIMRDVMLGIQMTIVLISLCGILIMLNGVNHILKACNIPEKDSIYKEYLYFAPQDNFFKWEGLHDEIKRLPELDKMIYFYNNSLPVIEFEESQNPDNSNGARLFKTITTDDPTLPVLVGMNVEWFNHNIDRNRCVLISEKLFRQFDELGLLDNNELRIGYAENTMPLPIGGIIRTLPYDVQGETLIIISPNDRTSYGGEEYLLVPKPGKGKALARSVDETIANHAPECFNKMIYNYREMTSTLPDIVESARAGCWILGCVSLIICAMGIFSCITLDTRARRKEIAIRKVNGAKSKNIYIMFGRVYALLLVICITISIPVCVLINRWVEISVNNTIPQKAVLSPIWPIALGCSIIILLVIVIVAWQIRSVMQTDPARIIAKE
ncbi:MAG: ABC transporter permease, partial [Muribaculaceae bacterium]|nr:ABC transporter permease [Muribaculaceae bacterium]